MMSFVLLLALLCIWNVFLFQCWPHLTNVVFLSSHETWNVLFSIVVQTLGPEYVIVGLTDIWNVFLLHCFPRVTPEMCYFPLLSSLYIRNIFMIFSFP
jgi:hypothetical protein